MNRAKLLWFAGGAATAGIAGLAADWLTPAHTTQTAFLIVEEPVTIRDSGAVADEDMIANQTGEMMRECGARTFETTFLYNDHAATADLPLTPENRAAFACILEASVAHGYRINIELRPDPNAQTN